LGVFLAYSSNLLISKNEIIMRKTSLAFFAAALFVVGTLAANPIKDVEPSKNLSTQIHELLKVNTFKVQEDNDVTAEVRFTINQEGQIVVLSVETNHELFEGFVKSRLNYKKVELDNAKEGKLYTVPVRVTP
jgi:hypothetical protein